MRVSAYEATDAEAPALRAVCVNDMGPAAARTPRVGYEKGADLLRVLASPLRLAIIDRLATGDRCVHELMEFVGLPQTQVSQHLRLLKDAGLVAGRRRGREVVYSLLDPQVLSIIRSALALRDTRR
jgi:DNA-binding transcriptional ArsR family regulator